MEKDDKDEHLLVHKMLAHKILPLTFKEESLAHSTLPFILFTHFGSAKKRKWKSEEEQKYVCGTQDPRP